VILITNTLIDGLKERIANAASFNQSIGIIIPSNNYTDLICSVFEFISLKSNDNWVYLTINKPYETIYEDYSSMINGKNIKFIDCISHAAGISNEKSNCKYIESPSQLENILLEIMNNFKTFSEKSKNYLIIDSLSSLILYNDPILVTEFFTHLINRARLSNIITISFSIEEEMDENIRKILYLKSNKIIKLKESFI
jgi:archaellum biogenesis ATPase FlaH